MVHAHPADATRDRHGPAFAALDLGTNNCRLLIGAPNGGGFRVLDSFSRIVRLGEGLQTSGRLSPLAMDRAVDAPPGLLGPHGPASHPRDAGDRN